ncbi:MAG: hypothetical protein LQ349_008500 [Xanthoria aureola]|nr:MAG: hypothetical protein LQ349_008500 [Xanthoria aureola]
MVALTIPDNLAAILASFTVYGLIHRYAAGPKPSPARLGAVTKATSTLHSTLTTVLAIYFLRRCSAQWARTDSVGPADPADPPLGKASGLRPGGYPDDSKNPVLQTRSTLGNAITAIECGYLLQDIISLLREARLRHRLVQPASKPTLRSVLQHADTTLLFHHVSIALALVVLHYYILRDRDRGIYIIVQFLLMNSSTPILNLRWWLRTYHPQYKMLCIGSDIAFIAAFYMARVWLVGRIIRGYGTSHGYDSAWRVYLESMRLPCQLGTGALWIANTTWWALLVMSVVKRFPQEFASVRKAMGVVKR